MKDSKRYVKIKKELLTRARNKREVEGGADDPGECRDSIRKTSPELNLGQDKGQPERLLFDIASSKWKTGKKLGLLLNGAADPVEKDTETLLKTFFPWSLMVAVALSNQRSLS